MGRRNQMEHRYMEKPLQLKSLIDFCETNELQNALVTSIDQIGATKTDPLKITFLPAAVYAYNIGDITLKKKTSY